MPGDAASASTASASVRNHLREELSSFDLGASAPISGSFIDLLGVSRPSKFDHLVHYGGSYYCYLFNRALSSHIWRHGFKDDPFNADAGVRLHGLLRRGSVEQTLESIQALCPEQAGFRAEDVPLDAFIDQLSMDKTN